MATAVTNDLTSRKRRKRATRAVRPLLRMHVRRYWPALVLGSLLAVLVAVGFTIAARAGHVVPSHLSLIANVLITSGVWITTAVRTAPTERTRLLAFYRQVRPAGPGWAAVQAEAGVGPSPDSLSRSLLGWFLGVAFVYAALFGAGSFLYGRTGPGLVWLTAFVVSGVWLTRIMRSMWAGAGER